MLLAGIIILAHSFIPHTHHQGHICIINSPCYNHQVSLHSDEGPSENENNHIHFSAESLNRLIAVEYLTDNDLQADEPEIHDIPFSTESTGNPDPDENHADDTKKGIEEKGHSDHNEAVCLHNIQIPGEEENHTHDGHCHADGCALFEILVYDPLGRKPAIECPCRINDHNHSELVQAILEADPSPPASWHKLPYRQKPYIDTHSGHNHSLIPGLRAPPAC